MVRLGRVGICALAMALALGGCNRDSGESGRSLISIRSAGVPPDEFLVLPRDPLERPSDTASLPAPTPGGANRADPDNLSPMLSAMGARGAAGGVPASEAALVRAVGGASPDIRAVLAAENAAFREDNARRLERQARKLEGATIYSGMLLDPVAEAARLRAMGITVPLAPIGN